MNQTKGRCQATSSFTIVHLLHRTVHVQLHGAVQAPWIEALSLRTVARGKQYRDVHKQTANKQLLNFTGERERERIRETTAIIALSFVAFAVKSLLRLVLRIETHSGRANNKVKGLLRL